MLKMINKEEKHELKVLLKKYKKEISKGNKEHVTDLIAAMTILEFPCYSVKSITLDNTNLKTLMYWGPNVNEDIIKTFIDRKSSKYVVPTMEEINIIKNNYKEEYKDSYGQIRGNWANENAATTWIEMMINFGMIKEGQTIDLEKYKLADFITDDRLMTMINQNKMSIKDFSYSKKR